MKKAIFLAILFLLVIATSASAQNRRRASVIGGGAHAEKYGNEAENLRRETKYYVEDLLDEVVHDGADSRYYSGCRDRYHRRDRYGRCIDDRYHRGVSFGDFDLVVTGGLININRDNDNRKVNSDNKINQSQDHDQSQQSQGRRRKPATDLGESIVDRPSTFEFNAGRRNPFIVHTRPDEAPAYETPTTTANATATVNITLPPTPQPELKPEIIKKRIFNDFPDMKVSHNVDTTVIFRFYQGKQLVLEVPVAPRQGTTVDVPSDYRVEAVLKTRESVLADVQETIGQIVARPNAAMRARMQQKLETSK